MNEEIDDITQNEPLWTHDASFSVLTSRLISLFLFFIVIGLFILLGFISMGSFFDIISDITFTIPILIIGFFIRPALQYILYRMISKLSQSQVKFGLEFNNITPYTHAKRPIALSEYRLISFIIIVLLGTLPLSLYFIFKYPIFILGTAFGLALCVTELITLIKTASYNKNMLISDHPQRMGSVLFENPFV